MKNYVSKFLFTGFLLSGFFANAQTNNLSDISKINAFTSASPKVELLKNSILIEELSRTNPRVFRDLQSFANVENIHLSKTEQGMTVFCLVNGIKTRMIYNKNGRRLYSFQYYGEDKMPKELRHLIKTNYYDHHIAGITELNMNSNTVYIINLEDSKSWIFIKVVNNELSIINQYSKTNP